MFEGHCFFKQYSLGLQAGVQRSRGSGRRFTASTHFFLWDDPFRTFYVHFWPSDVWRPPTSYGVHQLPFLGQHPCLQDDLVERIKEHDAYVSHRWRDIGLILSELRRVAKVPNGSSFSPGPHEW